MTKIFERSKGMTLVEMVIVISIMISIAIGGVTLFSDNNSKYENLTNNSELLYRKNDLQKQPNLILEPTTFIKNTPKEINIDFKNSEKIIYPLIASIFGFLLFLKFNKLLLSFNSFLNVIRTKKMLSKINKSKKNDLLQLTNLTEIQIITNKNILNLNKSFVSLSTYNDLLISKHNSLIEMISNNK